MNLTVKQIKFINKLLKNNGQCFGGCSDQNIKHCNDCILKQHGLPIGSCRDTLALEIAVKITNELELSQKVYESREIQFFL